jgi:hypothetical protein
MSYQETIFFTLQPTFLNRKNAGSMRRGDFQHDIIHHSHVVLQLLGLLSQHVQSNVLPRWDRFRDSRDRVGGNINGEEAKFWLLVTLGVGIEKLDA